MPHEAQSTTLHAMPLIASRMSDPETSDTQSSPVSSSPRMEHHLPDDIPRVVLPESTIKPPILGETTSFNSSRSDNNNNNSSNNSNSKNNNPTTLPPRAASERPRRNRKASPSVSRKSPSSEEEYFSPRSIDMKKNADAQMSNMSQAASAALDNLQATQEPRRLERSERRANRKENHRRVNSDGVNQMRQGLMDPYTGIPFPQQQMQQLPHPHYGPMPTYGNHPGAMYPMAYQSLPPTGAGHNRVLSWQGMPPMHQSNPNSLGMQLLQPMAPHPITSSGSSSSSGRSGRRQHRRINSDGMTPVKEEEEVNPNDMDRMPSPQLMQLPPTMMARSFDHNASMAQSMRMPPMQSWTGRDGNTYVGMQPPPSTMGYPPPPPNMSHDPHRPPLPSNDQPPPPIPGSPNFQNMKPKRTRRKNRQRSASSNAAIPSLYGNFFQGPEGGNDGSISQSLRPSTEFNPRSEIMSLTSSFHGGSPQYQSSPKASAPSSYSKHVRHSSMDDSRLSERSNYGAVFDQPHPLAPNAPGGGDRIDSIFASQRKIKPKAIQSMRNAQTFMKDTIGVKQESACRNVSFLLLFVFHLIGMGYIGSTYGRRSVLLKKSVLDDNTSVVIDIMDVIYVASISGGFAVAVSAVALVMMTVIARRFVQVGLFLLIAMSFAWGTIGIGVSSRNLVPITGFIALALSVGYTFVVWERIPFHAANLATALTAVGANGGIVLIACVCQLLALAWANYYVYAIAGVYGAIESGQLHLSQKMETCLYVLFGISFYWTFNVLLVTVAGVVGRWWYQPSGAPRFCSENVIMPFCYAIFYSFGSICCGSLLVGPVRMLRQIAAFFRPNSHVSTLMCVQQCLHCVQAFISTCVDHIADRLNAWGFTYVGLYQYGFLDGGLNATELFKKRGWTMIISDDILPNILLMMSLVIGGITGCFAYVIENFSFLEISKTRDLATLSFSIGMVIGLVLTSVLFGIISSSVNAVIVCFASSPIDFEVNHPDLSNEMRVAWREVWPGSMDVVEPPLNVPLNVPAFEHEVDFLLP